MRLANKVQEWLDLMEWEDELIRDEEKQASQLSTGYGINGQSFTLYIQTSEERDWLELYLYAPIKVTDKKRGECAVLFNYINARMSVGSLNFLTDGRIRFRHVVDVEDAEPSPKMISNMLGAGANLFEEWFEEISAVALTKITAQEIIDGIEKGQESEEDEVPDEI